MAKQSVYFDAFSYADGLLSTQTNWEVHNTSSSDDWSVDSNRATLNAFNSRSNVQVAGQSYNGDQYASADVSFNNGVDRVVGLGLRMQPQRTTEDLYRVNLVSGSTNNFVKVQISKYVGGSSSNLALSTNEWPAANGDSFALEAQIVGTDITVFINGTQVAFDVGDSVTVNDFASGVPGLTSFKASNSEFFDNFDSGNIVEGGPSLTITEPVVPGTTTTFSTTNFVDPLTGVRITDDQGNIKELTLASQTSVSAPAVGDLDYALFGDVTLEVYNATESATATIAFNPPAGFNQIALEAGFATDQESFLYQYGGTPAVPDQMAYDPIASDTGETLTLQTNGYWTATGYGEWTVHTIDATDGYMEPFQFIWKSGSTPGNIISMRARRLKARANTAKPLRAR